MFRLALAALALAAVARGADAPRSPTHQVKLNGHTFTLPEGFTIEPAAGADLAPRPIAAAFDEKGRLYVTDSSGSNENVKLQLEKKPHRVLRLESTKGDGRFDKQTVFVKNVMLPQGCMWRAGSLYVAAPPHILKFTDTNDDGVADKEEVWFDGKTLTGCANDLHGPYPGLDGYIYWTKGAFAKQEYTVNGKKFATRAAHIFRAKPDGSMLEPVMTGGMDNPVDVVFTPSGDLIFSTTFFQHPANGRRDGLVHATSGAVFGKDHDVVHEHPRAGPHLSAPLTHLGPAAPAGLHRYESDQFGPEYANNLFCCQFNLRKVSRHVLVPKGSTYETRDSDFVVSDNLDFHPTDVIEDADGSLLIVDTGGWYKLCCPTSQLVKPDVTGGIYRVRKVGAHKEKVARKPDPLPPLRRVALERDPKGFGAAVAALASPDMHTRRVAAEALGRIGDAKAVPALLTALADDGNDGPLDATLTFALIEIGDAPGTAKGLESKSPRVRRACLAALSYLPGGLEPKPVLAELDAHDRALRDTAWWVAGRHPQWGDQLAGHFADKLKGLDRLAPAERDELAARLRAFAGGAAVQKALGDALDRPADATTRFVLDVMARSGLKTLPPAWKVGLASAVGGKDAEAERLAYAVLRAVPPTEQDFIDVLAAGEIARAASGRKRSDVEWLALLSAAPPGTATATPADLDRALKALGGADPAGRSLAAEALARAKLTPEQLATIAESFHTVGPLELPRAVQLFARSTDEKVGLALVAALRRKEVRPAVRAEVVKPILDKYPAAVKAEAEKLYAELAEARKDETARLDKLLSELKPGDVRRGQLVFNGAKANCAACHKVGYVGGTAGPDLTKVGSVRTARDLLESIVYPSASFARSYEPVRVVTTDDRAISGVLKADGPDGLVVVVAADREERVPRAEVASVSPGTVSLMPAGLDRQLTPQELADLLAFLQACR